MCVAIMSIVPQCKCAGLLQIIRHKQVEWTHVMSMSDMGTKPQLMNPKPNPWQC